MNKGQYILSANADPINFKLLVLLGCTVCACALSLYFTVSFWSSMGATVLAGSVLGVTGCVFECTKFYALPAFLDYKRIKNWGRAGVSLLMFLVLSFISMLAGIYALNTNLSLNAEKSNTQSTQYQLHLDNIAMQEQKIQRLMILADKDLQAGFRTRAKGTLEAVDKEQEYLTQLKNDLSGQQQSSGSGLNLPYVSGNAASLLVVILGALLELTTTFLLVLYKAKRVLLRKTTANPINTPKKAPKLELVKSKSKILPEQASVIVDKCLKYEEVKRKIQSKKITPTLRAVKCAENLGSDTVSEFFKKMHQEGVLIKSKGNRYKLAKAA